MTADRRRQVGAVLPAGLAAMKTVLRLLGRLLDELMSTPDNTWASASYGLGPSTDLAGTGLPPTVPARFPRSTSP